MTSSSPLCSDYHKYAVEWNTDRMVYYFDDVSFFVSNDAGNVMDPMRVVIGAQIDYQGYGANRDYYPGTPFPQYMLVDYFHYYTLNKYCSNNLTILTNTDLNTYWNGTGVGVQSNITFGNGSNTISLSSTDKMIFRAVNTITVNGELTVPAGAEFTLVTTPCN